MMVRNKSGGVILLIPDVARSSKRIDFCDVHDFFSNPQKKVL